MDEYNIGQLADGILAELTLVEEIVGDVSQGRDPWPEDVEQAEENIGKAQKMAAEILNRYEKQVGPIEPY